MVASASRMRRSFRLGGPRFSLPHSGVCGRRSWYTASEQCTVASMYASEAASHARQSHTPAQAGNSHAAGEAFGQTCGRHLLSGVCAGRQAFASHSNSPATTPWTGGAEARSIRLVWRLSRHLSGRTSSKQSTGNGLWNVERGTESQASGGDLRLTDRQVANAAGQDHTGTATNTPPACG